LLKLRIAEARQRYSNNRLRAAAALGILGENPSSRCPI
jgi:hypothetical protein